jgi:hypothetical protein
MPLTLRPTRLEISPVYAHLKDYKVFENGEPIGRMYEQRPPAPPDAAWVWSIIRETTVPLEEMRFGRRVLPFVG